MVAPSILLLPAEAVLCIEKTDKFVGLMSMYGFY